MVWGCSGRSWTDVDWIWILELTIIKTIHLSWQWFQCVTSPHIVTCYKRSYWHTDFSLKTDKMNHSAEKKMSRNHFPLCSLCWAKVLLSLTGSWGKTLSISLHLSFYLSCEKKQKYKKRTIWWKIRKRKNKTRRKRKRLLKKR